MVGNITNLLNKIVLLQLLLSNPWRIHGKIHHQAGISQMILVEHHGKESHATAQGWLHCEYCITVGVSLSQSWMWASDAFCVLKFATTSLLVLITIYACDLRGLSTMGLKGKLSGDIGGLTELRSLWVPSHHFFSLKQNEYQHQVFN